MLSRSPITLELWMERCSAGPGRLSDLVTRTVSSNSFIDGLPTQICTPSCRNKIKEWSLSQHNWLNCSSFVFFISFQVYTFLWWLYARDWGWWWWLGWWDGDHMWRQVLRMESLIRYECFYHPQFPGGWHSTNMQIVSTNAIYNLINELQLSH